VEKDAKVLWDSLNVVCGYLAYLEGDEAQSLAADLGFIGLNPTQENLQQVLLDMSLFPYPEKALKYIEEEELLTPEELDKAVKLVRKGEWTYSDRQEAFEIARNIVSPFAEALLALDWNKREKLLGRTR